MFADFLLFKGVSQGVFKREDMIPIPYLISLHFKKFFIN
jgi:hypothetical protein